MLAKRCTQIVLAMLLWLLPTAAVKADTSDVTRAVLESPNLVSPSSDITSISDHSRVLGRVGFLAGLNPPIIDYFTQSGGLNNQTPTQVGMRIWRAANKNDGHLDVGFDIVLGFQLPINNLTTTIGGSSSTQTVVYEPSLLSASFGVPLALYNNVHSTLLLIPNITLAGAWSHLSNSQHAGTFTAQFGLDVGPELHAGWFGMPELSFQPSLGVRILAASGYDDENGLDQSLGHGNFYTLGVNLALLYYPGAH